MKISNKMHVKNGLNIIIVGCGKVGMTLIEQLSKEGHDITIIDKNAAKVQEMSNLAVIYSVSSAQVLQDTRCEL